MRPRHSLRRRSRLRSRRGCFGFVRLALGRPTLLEIGGPFGRARVERVEDRERDDAVALGECDAAHAHRIAALEHAHVINGKADALAARRRQQHVILVRAELDVDNPLALVEPHGDLARAVHLREVGELVAPHRAARGGEHHVKASQIPSSSGSGMMVVMRSPSSSGSRLTSALPRDCGAASGRRHTFSL